VILMLCAARAPSQRGFPPVDEVVEERRLDRRASSKNRLWSHEASEDRGLGGKQSLQQLISHMPMIASMRSLRPSK
jgi:hypothetical protein